jgi:hypothetical protein
VKSWPALAYDDWADTAQTLHLWTQIVGKIRMVQTPPVNHSWHVTLYVTSRGLTTSPVPYGNVVFEITFDFVDHALRITTSEGEERRFDLAPMTVATFYERVMANLNEMRLHTEINVTPNEIAEPIPFTQDTTHQSYDAEAAARFWQVLVDTSRVFAAFRSRFLGKASPVHFFWGAPDLAVTRFSGREAPPHDPAPGLPLSVVQDAYSHEVSSAGFWPGGGGFEAAFYSYAYPEPEGFAQAPVAPAAAFYSHDLREFLLPYDAVRTSADPDGELMRFLQSTYSAAARLGNWDREQLERREAT